MKARGDALANGLHTLDDFYKYLGLSHTADYMRKLILVARLGALFPNLTLISCCGIGELIKFQTDFVEMMASAPHEANFWRCTSAGQFDWVRNTTIVAYEGAKRQKCFDVQESAPDECYEEWIVRAEQSVTEMLAEDAAINQLDAAAQAEFQQLVENAVDTMATE